VIGSAAGSEAWGESLGGINERQIADAVQLAQQQLEHITYIDFPWSRYQSAQAAGLDALSQELELRLQSMLGAAEQANARSVATGYAGDDLAWAARQIGRCRQISVVFSCLLSSDFMAPAGQTWYPIAMPWQEGPGAADCPATAYSALQQIWRCIAAKQPPDCGHEGLLLPGNPRLWRQLFEASSRNSDRNKAAQLIAEEHGGGRCVFQIIRTLNSTNSHEAFELDANNYRLSARYHKRLSAPRLGAIHYSLSLKHSHRTPLAYREVAEHCSRLRRSELASSIAITGSPGDHTRGRPSLCISEEPWWDLRTAAGCYARGTTGYLDGLYDDLPIPYYLAVNPLVLDRITLRLEQLAEMGEKGILEQLQQAKIQYLGIYEFRLGNEKEGSVDPSLPKETIQPLSGLRTKIGVLAAARGLGTNHGKGWGRRGFTGLRRQISVDWHLDKLHLIRESSPRLGMAIENVHHNSYVSEKAFDMLCSGVMPITYAGPKHALHRFLEPGAHLNVYGLKIRDVLDAIEQFTPGPSAAESIHRTAVALTTIFSSKAARDTTLQRLADRCERWVVQQCRTRAYRAEGLP